MCREKEREQLLEKLGLLHASPTSGSRARIVHGKDGDDDVLSSDLWHARN